MRVASRLPLESCLHIRLIDHDRGGGLGLGDARERLVLLIPTAAARGRLLLTALAIAHLLDHGPIGVRLHAVNVKTWRAVG